MRNLTTLQYQAGASGTVYNLRTRAGLRVKEANFHKWEYAPTGVSKQYGQSLLGFKRDAAVYDTTLIFDGPLITRKELIDALHADFERDIMTMTPGRLTWGDYYIDCYVVKSSTYPTGNGWTTSNDISIYCPYPFWTNPVTYTFAARDTQFSPGTILPSDFKLTLYGSEGGYLNTAAVRTLYGYVLWRVAFNTGSPVSLEAGERVEIDSRAKTVLHYSTPTSSSPDNWFDKLSAAFDPFQDFPPVGSSQLEYRGSIAGASELTIYRERSEPS